jgi:UDPglucose 6-dehydrogenase
MQIVVVGTGYVGLVTGTCFAEMGIYVTCVDIDPNRIKELQEGTIPIYEPGLEDLVKKNYQSGRVQLTKDFGACF